MATVREVVLPHHEKEDGTWNVKIRVTHKRKSAYIDTQHFVSQRQLRKDRKIKDAFIVDLINPVLKDYREKISGLGNKLVYYDAQRLASYLESGGQISADQINVIQFGTEQIAKLKLSERLPSAADMQKVVNSLKDYFRSDFVPVTDIRANFLKDYERYLKSPRTLTRLNQFKRPVTRMVKGLGQTGLHNHIRDLRILFNNIVEHYNDEDAGIIIVKHYPFKKYKIAKPSKNNKRKLSIKQVCIIRDCIVPKDSRIELSKELSMLSFYLCGMNAVDLYHLDETKYIPSRIDYNRSKTSSLREDNAFMSVKLPDVAVELYRKYAGKLKKRYSTHICLDQAISKGMIGLRKLTGIPDLDFYDLRHAFADIVRNTLGFNKDDVKEALNHKSSSDVTDVYLTRSWGIIDEIQSAIITYSITGKKTKRL